MLTSPVRVNLPFQACSVYSTNYSQPAHSAITSMCSSHHRARPLVCWISVNTDVLSSNRETHMVSVYQRESKQKERRRKCFNNWLNNLRMSPNRPPTGKIRKNMTTSVFLVYCSLISNPIYAHSLPPPSYWAQQIEILSTNVSENYLIVLWWMIEKAMDDADKHWMEKPFNEKQFIILT